MLYDTCMNLTGTLTTAEQVSALKEKQERNARQPAAADRTRHAKRSAHSHTQLSPSVSQLIAILG